MNKYGELIENVCLENYNTYHIKTYTKYLIKPKNINNLIELINYLTTMKINYFILGKGSNVILPDNTFNGVIILLDKLNKVEIKDNNINVEAGALLSKVALLSINNNLKGLENLANIPGTIGGALWGNAGANGSDIYTVVKDITILRDNKIITLAKKDLKYDYRYSLFKDNKDIILSCNLILEKGNKDDLLKVVNENREKRMNTQPLNLPNAGSVFKNPLGNSAGKLIDELGLKGFNINDAYISLKHANFIVNKGHATSKDIKKLISIIKEKVYNEYNITLELEQRIVEWE